jgi:hypothetical protein
LSRVERYHRCGAQTGLRNGLRRNRILPEV